MQGNPAGSLQLTATFTDYNQFIEPVLRPAPAVDLSNKVLTADVRLVSVTGATTFPGGVGIYVSTGAMYCYTPGGTMSLSMPGTTWSSLLEDLSTATGSGCTSDPTMVPQIGLHFYSNAASGDAGAFPGPITAVFQIDNVVAK
jgi:hypothetical protein